MVTFEKATAKLQSAKTLRQPASVPNVGRQMRWQPMSGAIPSFRNQASLGNGNLDRLYFHPLAPNRPPRPIPMRHHMTCVQRTDGGEAGRGVEPRPGAGG